MPADSDPSATVHFDYGTTPAYGSVSGSQSTAGVSPTAVSATLGSLSAGTTYHYRVVIQTPFGSQNGADRTFTTAPAVSGLRESARRWYEPTNGKPRRKPVGTTFAFTLSGPAAVTLTFTYGAPGRLVRGKCQAPKKRNRRGRKCMRTLSAGVVGLNAGGGTNSVRFSGRVRGGGRLKPGRYTLVLTAAGPASSSSAAKISFTILSG